jgi:hypothetical protein
MQLKIDCGCIRHIYLIIAYWIHPKHEVRDLVIVTGVHQVLVIRYISIRKQLLPYNILTK